MQAAAGSVNVENQNACKLWRAYVCTFRKSRRRVTLTERSMAESKKRTGTSIRRRMSDFFSVLSSTITSERRKEPFCSRSATAFGVNVEHARRHNFHVVWTQNNLAYCSPNFDSIMNPERELPEQPNPILTKLSRTYVRERRHSVFCIIRWMLSVLPVILPRSRVGR